MTAPTSLGCDAIVAAMRDRSYERNEQDFIRIVVRPGMHVADVGAHIGFHAALLAELVGATGSVTAFEPIAEHAHLLSDTIRERGFDGLVTVVQAAAADRRGTRDMVVAARELASANAYFHTGSRLTVGARGADPVPDEHTVLRTVPVLTLDETLSDRPIGFLKIDAEGAEALVLRGARRLLAEDHPVVLVDLHPHLMARLDGTTPAALIDEMAGCGYECRLLGAGVPGAPVADLHARGVTTVVLQ